LEVAFDIVIPTTRLVPERLTALLDIHDSVPGTTVSYTLVIDTPAADLAPLAALIGGRPNVKVLVNDTVLGAHQTRNRGIDAGQAELIVFLDDDVVPREGLLAAYRDASLRFPEWLGYVGVTRFPPPDSRFRRGIVASDILTFFDLSSRQPRMPWGVTANLCLRRSALGPHRFSPAFPKAGGGEDIDLCLRLGGGEPLPLLSVPGAVVEHPWWESRRGSYRRFFRWAYGDGRLPVHHPAHRYMNAPSLPEVVLASMAVSAVLPAARPLVATFLGAWVLVEFSVDYLKLRRRGHRVSAGVAIEATLIRLANDTGRLAGNLARLRPWALGERFDYFCDGVHVAGERRVAFAKLCAALGAVGTASVFAR
jgi:GT2 family glycosyltransferase